MEAPRTTHVDSGESGGEADESGCETDATIPRVSARQSMKISKEAINVVCLLVLSNGGSRSIPRDFTATVAFAGKVIS